MRPGQRMRAAMPLYEKSHSWGEFVFDWSWARAYDQAGFDYYPKLVSALPFTPATGRRLLLRDETDTEAGTILLDAALALAEDSECSSLHVLFPDGEELPAQTDAHWDAPPATQEPMMAAICGTIWPM